MKEFEKYFYTPKAGGYSNCIDRGDGFVLPNCVGFAWGIFALWYGTDVFKKRPICDAKFIYEKCKPNGSGFYVGQEIRERSLAVYGCGTESGHVLAVLKKVGNTWICLESNYSGTTSNGRFLRFLYSTNPKNLYKDYKGSVYYLVK